MWDEVRWPGMEYENSYAVVQLTEDIAEKLSQYAEPIIASRKTPVLDFGGMNKFPSLYVGQVALLYHALNGEGINVLRLRNIKREHLNALKLAGVHRLGTVIVEEGELERTVVDSGDALQPTRAER